MKPLPWLAPLVPIYGALLRAKNTAYDRGLLSIATLKQPVISIGNLSTGGSGKTPVVIALAKLLTVNGISVDVLSRGYGRTSSETLSVPATGDADAERYGDEPLLIARATGVPVFVAGSRYAAGLLAEQAAPPRNHVHLLDDGFQHRQLARALDIVVLHPTDLTTHLLPAGHLREPLSSLGRAQALVVREEDRESTPAIQRYFRAGVPTWHIRRTLTCEIPDGPAVAFCGIARPEEFFSGLHALGMHIAAVLPFADHYRYTQADLSRLINTCRKMKTLHLVTTEKDAVRSHALASALTREGLSLTIAKLETVFLEPDTVLETVRIILPSTAEKV